jgi:hypothetical protein
VEKTKQKKLQNSAKNLTKTAFYAIFKREIEK